MDLQWGRSQLAPQVGLWGGTQHPGIVPRTGPPSWLDPAQRPLRGSGTVSAVLVVPGPTGSLDFLSLEMKTNPFKGLLSLRSPSKDAAGCIPTGTETSACLWAGSFERGRVPFPNTKGHGVRGHSPEGRAFAMAVPDAAKTTTCLIPPTLISTMQPACHAELKLPRSAGFTPQCASPGVKKECPEHSPCTITIQLDLIPPRETSPSGLAPGTLPSQLTSSSQMPPSQSPPVAAVTRSHPGTAWGRDAVAGREQLGVSWPQPLPLVSLPTVPSLAQPLLGHGGTQGVVKAELPASDLSHRILQVPAGLRAWSPPARVAPAVV